MKCLIKYYKISIFLLSFGLSIYFAFLNYHAVVAIAFLAFSFLVFIQLDGRVLELLKFQNFEVRMNEVKNTIKEIKEVAKSLAEIGSETIKTRMRVSSKNMDAYEMEVFDRLCSTLEKIGLSHQEIMSCTERFHFWNKYDYVSAILGGSEMPKNISTENKKNWHARASLLKSPGTTPEALRFLLKEFEVWNEEVEIYIKDYQYYINNNEHRDVERWLSRRELYK